MSTNGAVLRTIYTERVREGDVLLRGESIRLNVRNVDVQGSTVRIDTVEAGRFVFPAGRLVKVERAPIVRAA